MKRLTKVAALLLSLLFLTGCILAPTRCITRCVQNLLPERPAEPPVAVTTFPPTPQMTEAPQPTDAPAPVETETTAPAETAAPEPVETQEPQKASAADEAFLLLDDAMFKWYVTSDITTLDQFCAHPENFGINEADVPVTLGDFSEQANDDWVEACSKWRAELTEIDRSGLSEHLQFAYDTYCRYLDGEIESQKWFYNYEPLDEYVGLHMNLPLVFGLYMFKDEQDVQNYMTLLSDVPRYMGQVLAFEQERANRGFFMTEDMLDVILNDLETVANSAETSYLHDTFREAMEKADFLTDAQKSNYIAQNDALVNTSWVQGYRLLYNGLKELRGKCREPIGAYKQGGNAYDFYCFKLKHETSSNRTVDEEIALLERCIVRMYTELIRCAKNCYDQLKLEPKLTTGSLKSDEAYLKTLMPKIVPEMPDVEVDYLVVPEELQESFSPAAYLTPALDDYTHNIILTNPKNDEDYTMSTLAHEGYPGHMYQFTYQYALGTIPKFQLVIETNGYAESWSTNSELNVARVDEKFGADLATAIFLDDYLTNLIVTVCTLMVNGQGADRNEIREYLKTWGMTQATDKIYEISINMPIYYFKYAGGFAELYDLTERCKERVKNFESVSFFREYLSWGPGYFDLLNERMDAWVNAQ